MSAKAPISAHYLGLTISVWLQILGFMAQGGAGGQNLGHL